MDEQTKMVLLATQEALEEISRCLSVLDKKQELGAYGPGFMPEIMRDIKQLLSQNHEQTNNDLQK